MRRIVDGKVYDTEKATAVGELYDHQWETEGILYVCDSGGWFFVTKPCGSFNAVSTDKAYRLLCAIDAIEEVNKYFPGHLDEEPGARLTPLDVGKLEAVETFVQRFRQQLKLRGKRDFSVDEVLREVAVCLERTRESFQKK